MTMPVLSRLAALAAARGKANGLMLVAALVLPSGAAGAADLLSGPPPTISSYYWQGPYAGANLGYQWGSVRNNPTDPDGVTGGV